jgi:cytochrome c-type biogenesis protein CcmH
MRSIRQVLILIVVLIFLVPDQAHAALYDEIQESLICPACLDDRMTVAACQDRTAEETRQDIQTRLSSGQTKDEIIQAYVAEYGEIILAVPQKSGFNILAWVLPPVALLGGTFLVYYAVNNWVKNSQKRKPRKKDQTTLDPVDQERLNEEMLKYL